MVSFQKFIEKISKDYKGRIAFEIRRKIKREVFHYKDLPVFADKISFFLKSNGVDEGGRVIIWGLNCPEYSLLLLSCFSSRRIAVPIDYRNSQEMILKVVSQTKPKLAFVSKYLNSEFLDKKVDKIFYIEDLLKLTQSAEVGSLDGRRKSNRKRNPVVEIVYTSGTTGFPKGVMLSEQNILNNMESISCAIPDMPYYETLSLLPLSHMLEQIIGLFMMLKVGGKVVYLPRINSNRMLEALRENNVTHLVFVPQLFNIFLDKIKQRALENSKLEQFESALSYAKYLPKILRKRLFHDVHKIFGSSFQFFGSAGAPLNLDVAKIWESMGFTILEGYGATEVTAGATINRAGSRKLGSVGKVLPNVTVEVDNDNQIIIGGNAVSKGYYNNLEKTKRVFVNGKYKTGDIGKIDKEGFVYILGRDDFKIVLPSGEKVYAEDLERKINSSPYIKDSCVMEVSVGKSTAIMAYVLLDGQKKAKGKLKDIFNDINKTLESKQQIRIFKKWPGEDFPRTHTLKIDRKVVKARMAKGYQGFKDASQRQAQGNIESVYDIISNLSGIPKGKISQKDKLSSDLKLDSITRIELVSQIEEYLGVTIEESKITLKTTVKDLTELVKGANAEDRTFYIPNKQFTRKGRLISFVANKLLLFPLHNYIIKIDYKGLENINKLKGHGFIVTFNHPGTMDGFCVLRALSKMGINNCCTLGSSSFWSDKSQKLIRFGLENFAGGLPLYETGYGFIKIMQKVSDLLDKNYCLLYAPQGRLQRYNSQDKFKQGIGYMVDELDVPVLPIRIDGYEKLWPPPQENVVDSGFKELLPKKRGKVNLTVGEPIFLSKEGSSQDIIRQLEKSYSQLWR